MKGNYSNTWSENWRLNLAKKGDKIDGNTSRSRKRDTVRFAQCAECKEREREKVRESEEEETRKCGREREEQKERGRGRCWVRQRVEEKRRGERLPHCTPADAISPLSIRDSPCVLCRSRRRITRRYPLVPAFLHPRILLTCARRMALLRSDAL